MIAHSNKLQAPSFPGTADEVTAADKERRHHVRVRAAYWLAAMAVGALFLYGRDYYFSSAIARALSPKHAYLKPSGTIGLRLGMFGFLLCLLVGLYPLRKRWAWLGRQGLSRRWLDYHGLLGILAPLVITLHSSFKFSGFAGVAYWIMILVALSGLAGRYLYAQIPPTLTAAELSLRAGREESARLRAQLSGVLSIDEVEAALRVPDVRRTEASSLGTALGQMIMFDLLFPFRVWRLRRSLAHLPAMGALARHVGTPALDRVIGLAREEAQLQKKLAFLSQSERLLHLWHVIHRPFSASFAVLVVIHVALMLMLGFY